MGNWGCIIFIVVICGGWGTMIETMGPQLTVVVCCVGLICFAGVTVTNYITRRRLCEKCRSPVFADQSDVDADEDSDFL